MIVKVTPQWREPEILAPPWEIVHTVELPPGDFRKFKEDLLQAQPFIMEHASEMYMDEHGLTHGMLVLCEGIDDGILVNSEGSSYARYAAYISGARTLALMNRYPSLYDFCVGMDALVEKVLVFADRHIKIVLRYADPYKPLSDFLQGVEENAG